MPLPPSIDPHRHAVFLDFDGTLVEFVDDPQAVAIAPAALDRLEVLQAELAGALAVVSGRRIADLDRFLAPMRFAAAGVHGLERRVRPGDEIERLAGPETLDDVRKRLERPLRDNPRLKLEDKGTALVLHYRTAPDLKEAAEQTMAEATAGRHDLAVMNGDNIVEVHPAGMDKGQALAAMMKDAPFAGRVPIYVGDDTTDEFALEHVRDAGGVSIKVGDKHSVAEFRLTDVTAVHRWLAASA
ncbi:trehalose-phosphatase [Aurantimonas sp. C2-6-R+9]|uniref:trehalose-phosphatase n=1 Tax=unclassified Aurantimonas TaxID=2638230 RepID=UPI002E188DBD|nr:MULTISPECIES: trehalose-phosphatase [unclassified Aurantimonas]MEC5290156.1 trehalose-phosphatase [Aurantimonas sp. C2-3-R2]MEC5380269.1 trehalose-phosphatase [Aurantimonas sp. C2-6-R+9]MEC5411220.1 trehalose-phosphatase [Aurantimonas sp. C2-4-R8]